jgi:EF-hand domain pair
MFFLAGSAASSALDLISALQQTLAGKTSSTPAAPAANGQSFDLGAGSPAVPSAGSSPTASAPLAPATMDALLSAQGNGQTPVVNGDAFSAQLFSMLDANHDGSISQSEFDAAFAKNGDTTKADAIFAKLDANHDGNVSPDELTNALSGQGDGGQGGQDGGGQQVHHHRRHHGVADLGGANSPTGAGGSSNDPFSSNDPLGSGDSSQTVTNTDGSSTTTITYADGSQVTMTIPASSGTGSNPSTMAHNFIERMIQRQAQMMGAASTGQTLAISA